MCVRSSYVISIMSMEESFKIEHTVEPNTSLLKASQISHVYYAQDRPINEGFSQLPVSALRLTPLRRWG